MIQLPIEAARRLEVLASVERRSLSNYLQGLLLDHLASVPGELRQQVKERLLVSTSFLEEPEAKELQKYLEENEW